MITLYFEQVLDEADRLLNEDFEESLNEILQMIPRERRTFLFSATMTKKICVNLLINAQSDNFCS